MPAGQLKAVFAFEVAPQQTAPFGGGRLTPNADIQTALDTTFDMSNIAVAPKVNFEIDTKSPSRSHAVRDSALAVGFGTPTQGLAAAEALAGRLAASMDHRSKPTLLMITVHNSASVSRHRIMIWTFPQQEVFRLDVSGGHPKLDLLDAFNRESRLRKAAMLEGGNTKTDLLSARVLDFQSSATERAVADLWIIKFLNAKMQMSSQEGTRILAKALRHTHDRTRGDVGEQAEVHAAITGLRTSQRSRWSIESIATQYFSDRVSSVFRSSVREEERRAMFIVDTTTFDKLVQYRIFQLENGVLVSAPFSEVGTGSVQVIEGDGERRLVAQGVIEREKVRSRAT